MPSSKLKPVSSFATSGIQSPSFQPPSYYAAANGIPYPRTPRLDQIPSPQTDSKKNCHLTTQYERFMPISYLPDPSSSDSSFECRPTRKLSGTRSSPNRSTPRGKRRSQIADLPQIEAQLLPSLRDTIDKMTRPSSLLLTPPPISPDGNILHDPFYRYRDNCTDQSINPPDFSSNAYESQGCDRPRASLLPSNLCITNIKSPVPRPSLLKPACPVSTSRTPEHAKRDVSQTQLNSKTAPVRTPTLRSVKSLLTRKLSTNSSSPAPPSFEMARKSILKDKPRTPTPTSRLVSTLREKKVNFDCYPSNPKLPPTEAKFEIRPHNNTPHHPEKRLRSNIPRLRTRFASSPNRSQNLDDTDSSSAEGRYEYAQNEQRRLIATNADEPPSSSSDGDSDSLRLTTSIRPGQGIGLGLNCHFPTVRSPHFPVGEGDMDLKYKVSIHETPRSSVTSSVSSDSQYSTESDDQALPLGRNTKEEGQRRAALLSLVSTLDQKPLRPTTQSSEGSEYHGQQGIAYSASAELRVLQESTLLEPGYDSLWPRTPVSQACTSFTRNVPASPNKSTPKQYQYRRRSQYMPGPLPLSVPDNSFVDLENEIGRKADEEIGKEAARLARQSLMAATRERKAFGLKPSDSDMFHQRFENFHHREKRSPESSVSDAMTHHDGTFCESTSHILESIEARENHVERQNGTGISDGVVNSLGTKSHGSESMSSTEANPSSLSILRELLDTEETFVANMQSCIQTYVLPLRANGSKAWISGVPPRISRFLDWFEDTLRLHERLLEILRGRHCDALPQVLKFLPSFEIYQPYIARLGEFTELLGYSMDEGSDFGHFVTLQDKQIRQSGWSLSKYISEPERRLQKYPELFSVLLEITPRQDPQYLLIFSLLHSMEVIIDVMNTVKQEEERHRMLSWLLARFQGANSIAEMADRERTVLWHGFLSLRLTKEETRNSGCSPYAQRAQRLSKAVTAWDANSHNGLDNSISSQDSVSSYPSSDGDSRDDSPARSTASIVVYAVVLSDLVLFGARSSDTSKPYRLIDEIGKCRIFTVHELDPSNAFLEVIPVDTIDTNPNHLTSCIEGLYVTLSDSVLGITLSRAHQQDWFSALRRSASHTAQLWCVPWKFNTVPRGHDTARFLASLVNSGLPLPRSPSGRLPEISSTEGDASIQEREERGWWSFRFHQVMYNRRQMVSNTMQMVP